MSECKKMLKSKYPDFHKKKNFGSVDEAKKYTKENIEILRMLNLFKSKRINIKL